MAGVEGAVAPSVNVSMSSVEGVSAAVSTVSTAPAPAFAPSVAMAPMPGFAVLSGDVGPQITDSVYAPNSFEGLTTYSPAMEGLSFFEGLGPQESSVMQQAIITDTSDEAVATKATTLAEELGMSELADGLTEEYGLEPANTDQENVITNEEALPTEVADEENKEEVLEEASETTEEETVDETKNEEQQEDPEEKVEEEPEQEKEVDEEEEEDEKKPPEEQPKFVFVPGVNQSRMDLALGLFRRGVSSAVRVQMYKEYATVSPALVQLGLSEQEDGGVVATANELGSATSEEAVVRAVKNHSGIALGKGVFVGLEAPNHVVTEVLGGSRRNPF